MEQNRDMPLSGIKVLELATVVAAPSACELLCSYGAEVIKVEPLAGETLRRGGRQLNVPIEDNKNPLFTLHNNGKRFAAINIQRPEGRKAFFKLLEDADVFVTNMRMGPIKRLGLDYDSLKDRFPRLIYADLTGFGKKGPDARRKGYDTNAYWLRSGAVSDWQEEGDNVPFYPAYGFGDLTTGMILFSGILMGLLARERTGRGTEISTSLFAASIWYNGNSLLRCQFDPDRKPNSKKPANMINNYYRCGDGEWIFMCSMNYMKDYKKVSKLLGLDDICTDPRFADYDTLQSSGAAAEAAARYAEVFKSKSSTYWKKLLIRNDVACEVVGHITDICTDEQAIKNNYITEVEFADNTKVMMPVPPLRFSSYETRSYERTGSVGSDTETVLRDVGYNEEEIEKLRADKTI